MQALGFLLGIVSGWGSYIIVKKMKKRMCKNLFTFILTLIIPFVSFIPIIGMLLYWVLNGEGTMSGFITITILLLVGYSIVIGVGLLDC